MADKCGDMLRKIGGLTSSEIDDVLHAIDDLKNDPDRQAKVKQLSTKLLNDSEEAKRTSALRAIAMTKFMGRHMQWAKDALGTGRPGRKVNSLYEAGSAFLVGNNKDMVGGRYSVDKLAKDAGIREINTLDQMVKKVAGPKWLKMAHDKPFTLELVKAMGGEETSNPTAKSIAKIFSNRYRRNIKLLNSAGADIQELQAYRFTQNQIPGKVAQVGQTQWINDMMPLLDMKKMFYHGARTPQGVHDTMSQIYNDIVHMKYQDPFSFVRSRTLADQLGRHRAIHFKDAESAIKANDLYGHDTPLYNMLMHAQRQLHDYQMMQMLGPDPEKFYDFMKQSIVNESNKSGTQFSQFDQTQLDRDFDVIMNRHNQIASYTTARVFQSIRDMTMMAHLGFSTVSAFSDAINGIAAVHRAGMPLFQSIGWAGKTFLHFLSQRAAIDPEFQKMMGSISVGHEAALHYVTSRWDTGGEGVGNVAGSIPDILRRANGVMFMANRQAYWDDVFKFATTHAIMNQFASHSGKEFEQLGPIMRRSLESAGFDKPAWDKIRATEHTVVKNQHFISYDKIADKEVANRYATMLMEESERTVPLPGARQTATMHIGGKKGVLPTELWRTMLMFKSFPMGIIQKVWPNIQDGGFPMVITAALGSIMMGYMGNSLKNVLSGREPDDIRHFHTWLASAASGGMGSIFTDFASDQKPTDTIEKFVTGPALGEIGDLATIPWTAAQPHLHESRGAAAAEAAVHFARTDIPFTNLWATKLLYQYGMIYPLMEASHPGSVKKSIDDAQRKYNSKFWLTPSQAQQ